MIKLIKKPEPAILSINKVAWTAELIHAIETSPRLPKALQGRYNHPEIKSLLLEESHGKCMYCESAVGHVTYQHIEHIKPKARDRFPQLSFEWSNLGLSCPKCNMNKADQYDDVVPFINPYEDDPYDHFLFMGPIIKHRPGDLRAELTEKTLELNRAELMERRMERLNLVTATLDKIESHSGGVRNVNMKDLFDTISAFQPYSAFLAKYVENCGLALA